MAKDYHQADHALIGEFLTGVADGTFMSLNELVEAGKKAKEEWDKLPFNKLHPREPYFVFRGQDELAPRVISDYAARLETKNLTEQANDVESVVRRFISWQVAMPDVVRLPT